MIDFVRTIVTIAVVDRTVVPVAAATRAPRTMGEYPDA
jgi:hypothetical protein